jgi:hypothetical protein
METINFILLVLTSIGLVPYQTDPFSIVLNCTALFAISQLDDQCFGLWKLKLKNLYVFNISEQEERILSIWRIREVSVILAFCLMIVYVFSFNKLGT